MRRLLPGLSLEKDIMSSRLLIVASLIACGIAAPATAQISIGNAVVAQNDVTGSAPRPAGMIRGGDAVFQNEQVRTGASAFAKLVFLDATNLAIGPSSQVMLDRFVYGGGRRSVIVTAARGAIRFFSGESRSENYEIRTPQAVIGVRGTVFDVGVSAGRTSVVLREGALTVCPRSGGECVDLSRPGESAIVTNRQAQGPLPPDAVGFSFDPYCYVTALGSMCMRSAAPSGYDPSRPGFTRDPAGGNDGGRGPGGGGRGNRG